MKKKFSLWLNIVTICLCFAAIAIGVYAATSASLTVSGQIGFDAHGIDMQVTVHMYGHAITEDGEPITEANKVTLIGSSTAETTDDTMSLTDNQTIYFTQKNAQNEYPPIYFSDMNDDPNGKPTDIVIVITLKPGENLKFDVMATASGISTDENIEITTSATDTIISHDDATAKTITFTLSVKAKNGVYNEIPNTNNVSLNISLNRSSAKETSMVKMFSDDYVNDIKNRMLEFASAINGSTVTLDSSVKIYAERFPYYITLGKETATNTDLKWLIVGVEEDNDTISPLTDADKTALAAGNMIKGRNYYLITENILYADTPNFNGNSPIVGVSFQNAYKYDSNENFPNSFGFNANDYATSNVRAYLNGATVSQSAELISGSGRYTPAGSPVTFYNHDDITTAPYAFTQEELNLIQARNVTDLYKDDCMRITEGTQSTNAPTTGDIEELKQTSDKFWLLSLTEFNTIFKDDKINDSFYSSSVTFLQGMEMIWAWALRSPDGGSPDDSNDPEEAYGVLYHGFCEADVVGSPAFGFRPCIKIAA